MWWRVYCYSIQELGITTPVPTTGKSFQTTEPLVGLWECLSSRFFACARAAWLVCYHVQAGRLALQPSDWLQAVMGARCQHLTFILIGCMTYGNSRWPYTYAHTDVCRKCFLYKYSGHVILTRDPDISLVFSAACEFSYKRALSQANTTSTTCGANTRHTMGSFQSCTNHEGDAPPPYSEHSTSRLTGGGGNNSNCKNCTGCTNCSNCTGTFRDHLFLHAKSLLLHRHWTARLAALSAAQAEWMNRDIFAITRSTCILIDDLHSQTALTARIAPTVTPARVARI